MVNTMMKFILDKSNQFAVIALEILGIAIAWILLYQLNNLILNFFSINNYIAWIFLPAFIRIFAVIVFDWAGVIGLIIGAMITRDSASIDFWSVISLAIISGIAPLIAIKVCKFMFNLPKTFKGLSAHHLLIFTFAASVTSAGLHHFHFHYFKIDYSVQTFIAMMIGDLIGALVMLYLASFIIRLIRAHHNNL